MPDAESRAARNGITADHTSDAAPEGTRPPDRSAAESDPGLASRKLSVPRGQSLALRPGNALVTRGLQDIAQFGNRVRAEELLELGEECYGKNEFDQAIAYCTEAIQLDPYCVDAYFCRGNAHHKKSCHEQAVRDYTEAIFLNRGEYLYLRRARAYACLGDHAKAIADYSVVIGASRDRIGRLPKPETSKSWRDIRTATCALRYSERGVLYSRMGKYDNAIADFTEAIRLDPTSAFAYCLRAAAYCDKDDCDSAIADYTEAIRLKPEDAEAYYNRGLAYQEQGHHAEAESDFATAKGLQEEVSPSDVTPKQSLDVLSKQRTREALHIPRQVTVEADGNDQGKLYGEVCAADIVAALKEDGCSLTVDQVRFNGPLKHWGLYKVEIHLADGTVTELPLWVVPPAAAYD